jgi:hypothetical protein
VRTLAAALALLIALPALARENENLLFSMPFGYKVGYSKHMQRDAISEMVPAGETVENWTEMVTVQIFFHIKPGPQVFQEHAAQDWLKACKGASAHPVAQGQEKGYALAVWMLACPRYPETGKPEWTFFKAIQGNDSFYVVQKAFKFDPKRAQVIIWTCYLKSVSVCDIRFLERQCPAGMS